MTDSNQPLEEKIVSQIRWVNLFKIVFISLITVSTLMAVSLLIYQNFKIVDISKDARGAAESTRVGTARLVDCTTPGGKCYEQGRSATSGAVGSINKGTIAAIWCSTHLGNQATIQQLNTCVVAIVK